MRLVDPVSRRTFLAGSVVALGGTVGSLYGQGPRVGSAGAAGPRDTPAGAPSRAADLAPDRRHVAALARDTLPPGPGYNVFDPGSGLGLRVITREEWGADESIRFRDDGTESWREMFVPPRLIVVHHTATPNSYRDLDEAMAEVRSIYAFHTLGRSWGDIGYHAVIDRFGHIFEGRHGRGGDPGDDRGEREILTHAVTGGHTTDYEYGTVGVALLGDTTSWDWEMTEPSGPMWEALVRYCTFEAARSGIVPLAVGSGDAATTDFLRSDEVWHDGVHLVCGHREVQQTYCPGDSVVDLLPALRSAVQARIAPLRFPALGIAKATGGRLLRPGAEIACSLVAPQPEDDELLGLEYTTEGWFKPADSEDLAYYAGYTDEAQPRVRWRPAGPGDTIRFVAATPGHYGVHVRAILSRQGTVFRSVDRASLTYLVPDPAFPLSGSVTEKIGD